MNEMIPSPAACERLHEHLPAPAACRVAAVVDTAALADNYRLLLDRVRAVSPGTEGIAVVKADAYGHGIRLAARALVAAGCRAFAVACAEEALALRGVLDDLLPADTPSLILVLGYTSPADVPRLSAHRITVTLLSASHAAALAAAAREAGVRLAVHAALDTGMNRIGYPAHTKAEAAAAAEAICRLAAEDADALSLDGLFTHFARADEDYDEEMLSPDSLTMRQYANYHLVVDCLSARGCRPRMCHICNSAASVRFPGTHPDGCLDAVRLGISLYGYGVEAPDGQNTRPALRLVTVVSHIHDLAPGESVGYGGDFASDTPRRLVTLPVGYADGWLRAFSGASVTLHTPAGDFPAPIVGRICMDQCMADITDLPPAAQAAIVPGETAVTLLGASRGSLEALARQANTITYELLCLITARVPRYEGNEGCCTYAAGICNSPTLQKL